MILGRIKQMRRIFRELRYLKRILNTYGGSLRPGSYQMFPSMRAIAAVDSDVLKNADRYFAKNIQVGITQKMIAKINKTSFYCNKKCGATELYDAVYVANNYDKVREIKLFSFDRKEILTVCTSAKEQEKQITEYEKLHRWFGMPRAENQSQYENAYKIAMVDLLPRPDEKLALENIVQCICAYRLDHLAEEKSVTAEKITSFAYSCQELNDLLTNLTEKISSATLEKALTLCLQHGDLSRDNLIYGSCNGKTGFWWIDWEHARPRLFFYDYFFYMLNTALYFKDTSALDAYLHGNYDDQLHDYFSQFGLQYDPDLRKDYFLIFAVDFLKERVCDRGNLDALKMYLEFINQTVLDKV